MSLVNVHKFIILFLTAAKETSMTRQTVNFKWLLKSETLDKVTVKIDGHRNLTSNIVYSYPYLSS